MSARFVSLSLGLAFGCAPVSGSLTSDDDLMGGGAGGSPDLTTGQIPCEIARIFTEKCHECHGSTRGAGVPMSLVTLDDVHRASISHGFEHEAIYERIGARIHDPMNPMPPRIYPQLTPQELDALDAWVAAGAPAGAACAPPSGAGGSTSATGGTSSGGSTGGTAPQGGSGGSTWGTGGGIVLADGGILEPDPIDRPVEPDPSECTWVDIKARSDASGTPYTVAANAQEQYRCFSFNIPEFAAQKTHGLAFYSINEVEDAPVVHHWLLYQSVTQQTNGASADCLGTHLDAALIAGWAPGATPWFLPAHVGIDLGPNFILEIHYNNPGGPATPDASGVRMCTTTDTRPETASVSWLGADFFPAIPPGAEAHETKARCTPQTNQPIHVLRTWPHMHLLGRRMRATLHRAGGGSVTYHDEVFDFNYQIQYDTPIVLNPGDSIETTCVFRNQTGNYVGFGQDTTQEMCYNFTVAYPAGRLVNALPSVHTNACLNEPAP
jgi:hypothetical protein